MTKKISDLVYFVGVFNPNLRVSDIIIKTDFGTSYNSFIIKDKKIALIETCHHDFLDSYLENIKQVCEPELINYIILNHTEPDHSGALKKLLDLAPNAKIICSKAAKIYLKNIINKPDFEPITVKDNDELDLGDNKLKFISAPFLHWPDSMFSYLEPKIKNKNQESKNILFTCDFLGCHYCLPDIFDYKIKYQDAYELALKNYFDNIFGPFKNYVLDAINKISSLNLDFILNSHGPILTKYSLDNIIKKYEQWALDSKKNSTIKSIPIFYCSAYNNTFELAKKIKSGILSQIPDVNLELYNIINYDIDFLANKLNSSDAFLIGSPTINRDAVLPVWNLLSRIDAINNKNKNVGVFGSFGWSGEAVDLITQRLNSLKLKTFGSGFKINFVPDQNDLQNAETFGSDFAKLLLA